MVEGESDTQSLWYMGLPALGVAGADLFKREQVELLQGLKLYVHKEPDQGGNVHGQNLQVPPGRGIYRDGLPLGLRPP